MQSPIRARLVFEEQQIADRVSSVAMGLGVALEVVEQHKAESLADLEQVQLLILEQRVALDVVGPRLVSLTGVNPDLLIVVIIAAPRGSSDRRLLGSGAFDVLDDGPALEVDLTHTLAAARRVVALQEERTSLNSELAHQDKLSAMGVLAAGVSHEINNPCAAILSNTNVLRDQLEALLQRPKFLRADVLEEYANDWLEAIGDCINAANRIHSIVKTLNVFSRKGESASPVGIDINEDIRTVLRLIGKEIRFQAAFEVDLRPDMPRILAPINSITQIITNLVVNALQAFDDEDPGEHARVWISTDYDEEHVMLEVRDNGPGIPPEILSRIFDPFFTTKAIGKGTGLGLSITQQLVHKLGGDIFAESVPGEGARFSVVIERSLANDTSVQSDLWLPPQSDRLRVLLLDDDELILRSMQRSLSAHFECQAVARASTALAVLASDGDFDAVVSDVVMPEMNGLEFWTELEHTRPELALKTVFISGGITSEKLHARVSDTGRPCLAKPVDIGELVRTIRRLGRPFEDLMR